MQRTTYRSGASVTTLLVLLVLSAPTCATAAKPDYSRLLERRNREPQPGTVMPDDAVVLGGSGGNTDWSFPSAAGRWLNSQPLSAEALRGKGIVLFFFEEECPGCASRWPDLMRHSEQYRDRPVLFVAVNSGSDPRKLQAYVRQQGARWPVIADVDRSFESEIGVSLVSMRNVVQVRYISSDGSIHNGKWSDLPATTEAALKGATWRVPPAEIPNKLKGAWWAIELGQYAKAAKAIIRDLKKEGPLKAPAEKLLAAVNVELQKDFQEAGRLFREKDSWGAYKQLNQITEQYKGYELPKTVEPALKKLSEDPTVLTEQKAQKSLDKAQRLLAKQRISLAERALKKLVASSPETEAAGEAKRLLAGNSR